MFGVIKRFFKKPIVTHMTSHTVRADIDRLPTDTHILVHTDDNYLFWLSDNHYDLMMNGDYVLFWYRDGTVRIHHEIDAPVVNPRDFYFWSVNIEFVRYGSPHAQLSPSRSTVTDPYSLERFDEFFIVGRTIRRERVEFTENVPYDQRLGF